MGAEERKQRCSTKKTITAPNQVAIEALVVAVANVNVQPDALHNGQSSAFNLPNGIKFFFLIDIIHYPVP